MSKSKNTEQKPSFESAIGELERIVTEMEGGQLSLDDSLSAYRRGVALLKCCQDLLADAETQLRQLDGDDLKPLELSTEKNR